MKVLIIGGGASGMMAALSALENPNNTVTLLERQSRVGKSCSRPETAAAISRTATSGCRTTTASSLSLRVSRWRASMWDGRLRFLSGSAF